MRKFLVTYRASRIVFRPDRWFICIVDSFSWVKCSRWSIMKACWNWACFEAWFSRCWPSSIICCVGVICLSCLDWGFGFFNWMVLNDDIFQCLFFSIIWIRPLEKCYLEKRVIPMTHRRQLTSVNSPDIHISGICKYFSKSTKKWKSHFVFFLLNGIIQFASAKFCMLHLIWINF